MRKFDFIEKAVKNLYPLVEGIAYDNEIDEITLTFPSVEVDQIAIRVEAARVESLYNGYQRQRAATYPQVVDQLDILYHGGYDAWKATIDAVKQQYPKPE